MAGERRRGHGALEAEVLAALRRLDDAAAGGGVSAARVREACGEPRPAATTVLTILDRLRSKGLVERDVVSPRRVRWSLAPGAVPDPAALLADALSGADREAVLLRFAGNLDADDVDFLRGAVARRPRS